MGRKPKMIIEPHASIRVDLPPEVNDLFRDQAAALNLSLKDYLVHLIKFRNQDERELEKMEHDLALLQVQEAELSFAIKDKKLKIEQDKALQEDIRNQQEYAVTSFRIMFNLIDRTAEERQIRTEPAILNQTYGIAFNIAKCNQNWDIVRELPDEELISYLSLKKIDVKARKNIEILEAIRKKKEVEI